MRQRGGSTASNVAAFPNNAGRKTERGVDMKGRDYMRRAHIAALLAATMGWCVSCWAAEGTTVLVAYHSANGNTEKMAQGVVDGVKAATGATAVLKKVGEVTADDLLSADAVIIGSPVYFANMAGDVKVFFG
jgi:flavorubredoxin